MKMYSLLLVLVLGLSQANAKTILISDIDDTIKNSHVLSWTDSLLNADNIENNVLGMNAVYHAALRAEKDLKFFYVTNAPKSLMQSNHSRFLSANKFPQGSLRLRDSIFQSDFKITEIRKILKAERPEFVILIGDNGEKDATIYDQITKEFPNILFLTYIRQPYSVRNSSYTGAALMKGQTGFVTALDLMLHLRKEGYVLSMDAMSFLQGFIVAYDREKEMNSDGTQAIPSWFDCRDFKWTAKDSDLGLEPAYVKAKNRILERCSIRALIED